jgi:hypothetical protein
VTDTEISTFNASAEPDRHELALPLPDWYPAAFCRPEQVTCTVVTDGDGRTVAPDKIGVGSAGKVTANVGAALAPGECEITLSVPPAVDVLSSAYAADVIALSTVELWLANVIDTSGRAFEPRRCSMTVDVLGDSS